MAAPQKLKPSTAGIWIGVVLILLGLGGCIGGPAVGGVRLANSIRDARADRFPVGESATFEMTEGADGLIAAWGPGSLVPSDVRVEMIGPDGRAVDIDTSWEVNSTDSGETFILVGAFTDLSAGRYTLNSEGEPGIELAIVSTSLGSLFGLIAGGIFGGGLLMLIGLIVLIVTVVRRSRARRQAQIAQYLPPPGDYGGTPGYTPQPGFGTPNSGYGTPSAPPAVPPAPPAGGVVPGGPASAPPPYTPPGDLGGTSSPPADFGSTPPPPPPVPPGGATPPPPPSGWSTGPASGGDQPPPPPWDDPAR